MCNNGVNMELTPVRAALPVKWQLTLRRHLDRSEDLLDACLCGLKTLQHEGHMSLAILYMMKIHNSRIPSRLLHVPCLYAFRKRDPILGARKVQRYDRMAIGFKFSTCLLVSERTTATYSAHPPNPWHSRHA